MFEELSELSHHELQYVIDVNLIAFLWKLISKEQVVVIMEFPDWFKLK